jgi:hypothetical protein
MYIRQAKWDEKPQPNTNWFKGVMIHGDKGDIRWHRIGQLANYAASEWEIDE